MSRSRPAVLSSALLARKGAAAPTGYTPIRPEVVDAETSANDSADARRPVIAPAVTAVGGPFSPGGARARVSVRLDRDRHLKLKLTAAHLNNSLQDIITDALDRYLEQIGPEVLRNDCTCLSVNNPDTPHLSMINGAAARDRQSD